MAKALREWRCPVCGEKLLGPGNCVGRHLMTKHLIDEGEALYAAEAGVKLAPLPLLAVGAVQAEDVGRLTYGEKYAAWLAERFEV